jgi:hypothetical protein
MMVLPHVAVIIPALNEETTIDGVVRRSIASFDKDCDIRIVVGDNGSNDRTARKSVDAGAEVVKEPNRGYGAACLRAIHHLGDWPDFLVFLDADGSSRPEEIPSLLDPLLIGKADLVIGIRNDDSAMTLPQRWGTKLAVTLVNVRWSTSFKDMGPFRAVRYDSYRKLGMRDKTWGWTIEMQILAVIHGLRFDQIPVSWEMRKGGASKISGTISGVVRAGFRILWTVGKYSLHKPLPSE